MNGEIENGLVSKSTGCSVEGKCWTYGWFAKLSLIQS